MELKEIIFQYLLEKLNIYDQVIDVDWEEISEGIANIMPQDYWDEHNDSTEEDIKNDIAALSGVGVYMKGNDRNLTATEIIAIGDACNRRYDIGFPYLFDRCDNNSFYGESEFDYINKNIISDEGRILNPDDQIFISDKSSEI